MTAKDFVVRHHVIHDKGEHKGFSYLIGEYGGTVTGFIAIPESHPLYEYTVSFDGSPFGNRAKDIPYFRSARIIYAGAESIGIVPLNIPGDECTVDNVLDATQEAIKELASMA